MTGGTNTSLDSNLMGAVSVRAKRDKKKRAMKFKLVMIMMSCKGVSVRSMEILCRWVICTPGTLPVNNVPRGRMFRR